MEESKAIVNNIHMMRINCKEFLVHLNSISFTMKEKRTLISLLLSKKSFVCSFEWKFTLTIVIKCIIILAAFQFAHKVVWKSLEIIFNINDLLATFRTQNLKGSIREPLESWHYALRFIFIIFISIVIHNVFWNFHYFSIINSILNEEVSYIFVDVNTMVKVRCIKVKNMFIYLEFLRKIFYFLNKFPLDIESVIPCWLGSLVHEYSSII